MQWRAGARRGRLAPPGQAHPSTLAPHPCAQALAWQCSRPWQEQVRAPGLSVRMAAARRRGCSVRNAPCTHPHSRCTPQGANVAMHGLGDPKTISKLRDEITAETGVKVRAAPEAPAAALAAGPLTLVLALHACSPSKFHAARACLHARCCTRPRTCASQRRSGAQCRPWPGAREGAGRPRAAGPRAAGLPCAGTKGIGAGACVARAPPHCVCRCAAASWAAWTSFTTTRASSLSARFTSSLKTSMMPSWTCACIPPSTPPR